MLTEPVMINTLEFLITIGILMFFFFGGYFTKSTLIKYTGDNNNEK